MPVISSITLLEELSSLTAGAICELPTYSASSLNGDVIVNTYYRFESETEKKPILESGFLVENIGLYEIIYEYIFIRTVY